MTIENSEDTAQVSVPDPAEVPVIEVASGSTEPTHDGAASSDPTSSARLEVARNLSTHDSAPPLSRKLAPPPKPKRDSGMASSMPPAQAAEAGPDLLASSSALKAPIAPTISYSADDTAKMQVSAVLPEPPLPTLEASAVVAPLSQPPPIPRRRSSPALALDNEADMLTSARAPSEPALTISGSTPPRPLSTPPRPRSDPPPPRPRSDPSISAEKAEVAPPVSGVAAAPAPSSSAIFAMRIIAVGDAVRAPVSQDSAADLDPNSYPPSASRLGTSVRRSSRPAPGNANATVEVPPPARLPTAVAGPASLTSEIATVPTPDVAPAPSFPPVAASSSPLTASSPPAAPPAPPAPPVSSPLTASSPPIAVPSAPVTASSPPPAGGFPGFPPVVLPVGAPSALKDDEEDIPIDVDPPIASAAATLPLVEMRPPPPPPPVELGAVPPEELRDVLADDRTVPEPGEKPATPEAEELGREDAISLPPEELAALKAELDAKAEAVKPPPPPKRTTGALNVAPPSAEAAPKEPPPTPDPAAAKAAQRAKTRQPWWEDLFSEDFMRAGTRVSDEQIRREVTFIEESLGVAAGGVVLDLGCGSGHHAVEFASRGYGVVGYDLSLYQLALAADVAQERSQKINFLQGDMREMAFEEMFDGVFCWNTTFGYFEEDKNLAVAQRVFKALRPGGMFLIDVLNRDFAAASAPCSVWYEGDSCVCMDDMSVDYISSRLRVKRSIILDDGRTKEALYSLRLYSLHELGKLLHEVGFRVTEASGHPATPGVFFGPNSPRIIMLAQRP